MIDLNLWYQCGSVIKCTYNSPSLSCSERACVAAQHRPSVSSCPSPCTGAVSGCGWPGGCWTRSVRPRTPCPSAVCWWFARTACRPDTARSSSASSPGGRGPRWSTAWAHYQHGGCYPAENTVKHTQWADKTTNTKRWKTWMSSSKRTRAIIIHQIIFSVNAAEALMTSSCTHGRGEASVRHQTISRMKTCSEAAVPCWVWWLAADSRSICPSRQRSGTRNTWCRTPSSPEGHRFSTSEATGSDDY